MDYRDHDMTFLRIGLLGVSGVAFALLSSLSQAASFDCSKASTFAETQICKSGHLQLLDEQIHSAYTKALTATQDKSSIRSEQRIWLKTRDQCTAVDCIADAMEARLSVLHASTLRQEPIAKPAAEPAPPVPQTKSGAVQAPRIAKERSADASMRSEVQAKETTSGTTQPSPRDVHEWRPFKIGLLVMGLLLIVCIWLHSRGTMVIYSCYTDALWTCLTPFLASATFFTARYWLELSTQTALISAAVVFGIMLLQVIIQTFRHNGFSVFFLLALYAKLLLFTVYFVCMTALIFGGAKTAAQRRKQRNLALGGSVLFALLTGWMTKTRSFSHIDDYIAGRT